MATERTQDAIRAARVTTPQGYSGSLSAEDGRYLFGYDLHALPEAEISLLMPRRAAQYADRALAPIFQMNLPEGYVLEQLRLRLAKSTAFDPMLLLALTGADQPIGRVRVRAELPVKLLPAHPAATGERLAEILAWDGAESIFTELADRYLLRSGVSGVQPKLLVPETPPSGKASVATGELIVKSGGDQFPGLAINEYACMSAVRAAGVPVPEFYLSDNHQLFVMRRFDRDPLLGALGFEDMAVLTGRGTADKYSGSYEQLARVIRLFCSEAFQPAALAQLFDQVALSCMLGNGDAHLKNFGVLYTQPHADDIRLAPAYDIVNTTAYIANDALALTLGGSKRMTGVGKQLHALARTCQVEHPAQRIEQLVAAVESVLQRERPLLATVPVVAAGLASALAAFKRER